MQKGCIIPPNDWSGTVGGGPLEESREGGEKKIENNSERCMPIDVVTTAAELTTTSDITAEDGDFKGVGRPTGSTDDRKRKIYKNNKMYINEITMIYEQELQKSKTMKKRIHKGFLRDLIVEKKNSFAATANISENTIRTRVK